MNEGKVRCEACGRWFDEGRIVYTHDVDLCQRCSDWLQEEADRELMDRLRVLGVRGIGYG